MTTGFAYGFPVSVVDSSKTTGSIYTYNTYIRLSSSGPHSFTGEDSVEFHVHGGPAILTRLMQALEKLQVHPALPGEFTRRAFYNDKLDLTEVEGLADLIEAETECQRKQALLQADGVLRKLYNSWRQVLSHCAASVEAYIDFGEEDNIESDVVENARDALKRLMIDLEAHLTDGRRGEILRSGVRTVIVGRPNVGKSSLLNHLVQRNAAIVTPVAGTTRDVIELCANISGYPVLIADTAGITDHTEDIVEAEGIRRARSCAESADFVVVLVDALKCASSGVKYEEYIREYLSSLGIEQLLEKMGKERFLVIMNKADLLAEEDKRRLGDAKAILISCKTEDGFKSLLQSLTDRFRNMYVYASHLDRTFGVLCEPVASLYLQMRRSIRGESDHQPGAAQKSPDAMLESPAQLL